MHDRILLQVEGIVGDVQIDDFNDAIELEDWSWGMQRSGTMHTADGTNNSRENVGDVAISKITDRSSVELMSRCLSGVITPKFTLSIVNTNNNPQKYLTLTMINVMISSWSINDSNEQDRAIENLTLNFEKFRYIYKYGSFKSGQEQGEIVYQWSIRDRTSDWGK